MSKHDKNHGNHQESSKATEAPAKAASDKASNVGVLNKDPKANLNDSGVSAKKAEECLAAACETGLTDLGQSGSVPVGQKGVKAQHLDAEQLRPRSEKEACKDDKHSDEEHQSVATIGLEVAAGLAMIAVDSAGKVFKDAGKNWEDKVDAAAHKAHQTIETAQRAIRDPLGETLKQMEHLTHPDHADKKK